MTILTADFHTHILSGIDDGSPSIEDSVEMLKQEQKHGIKTVCLTPHFNGHLSHPKEFLANRQKAMDLLLEKLAEKENLSNLILGAEVHFCAGMSKWEQLKQLSLGDTGYILIEMPAFLWTEIVYRELECIYWEQGLTPILAHIERYINPFNVRKSLLRLSDLPVLLQCNSSFLIDKRTQRTALKLLNDHRIHLIGSDCHSSAWRSPNMAQVRDLLLAHADEHTLAFLSKMESTVLKGEHIIIDNTNI